MNYDPTNFDVLFLIIGHRAEIDPAALAATLAAQLAPWYATPFAAVGMAAQPQWILRPGSEMTPEERAEVLRGSVADEYVASSGVLATMLPGQILNPECDVYPTAAQLQDPAWVAAHCGGPVTTSPRHRQPFDTAWPMMTGIRQILQQRSHATAAASRRAATAALHTGGLAEIARVANGRVVLANIVAYGSRNTDSVFDLPFPSTPALPGDEVTYRSSAVFALFAGLGLGAVVLAAALKKGR